MSPAFETYLVRLYTDRDERARFIEDPEGRAVAAGLTHAERAALVAIDRRGLDLAGESFERKRAQARHGKREA
jgi:hypothetical protein